MDYKLKLNRVWLYMQIAFWWALAAMPFIIIIYLTFFM